jgi:hypothetical protein
LVESGCWVHAVALAWSLSYSVGVSIPSAVAAATVAEDLEVLEQDVRELDVGLPAHPVEQFGLHASPEGLDDGVVAVADRANEGPAGLLRSAGERPGGELPPWSEWMIVPARGCGLR